MKRIIVSLIFITSLGVLKAQPSNGGGNMNPTPVGFTEVLILGGAALGLKKGFDNKKKA